MYTCGACQTPVIYCTVGRLIDVGSRRKRAVVAYLVTIMVFSDVAYQVFPVHRVVVAQDARPPIFSFLAHVLAEPLIPRQLLVTVSTLPASVLFLHVEFHLVLDCGVTCCTHAARVS